MSRPRVLLGVLILSILVFSSLALAASGSYSFKLVVDRHKPSHIDSSAYVNFYSFQVAAKETDENPGPMFYKVVYGPSWEKAADECDWPEDEPIANLPDDGWKLMNEKEINSEGYYKLKNYLLSGNKEIENSNKTKVERLRDGPWTYNSDTYDYVKNNAYVVVCVLAFDKTLSIKNAKKYTVKFTDPQNCLYDVIVEAWNPLDRQGWATGYNDHTHCAVDWRNGHILHHHFKDGGACRTFRDDACEKTWEDGGTGCFLMGFFLNNEAVPNFAADVQHGINTYSFDTDSKKIPGNIPNVVSFMWGLAAEDETWYSLSKYAGILLEKRSDKNIARLFNTDSGSGAGSFNWAECYNLNYTTNVIGGLLAAPQYDDQSWGKDSIDHGEFRFFLANASYVNPLEGDEKIQLKCNQILDILSVSGDDGPHAAGAGPAGVYESWMDASFGKVDNYNEVCTLLKGHLGRKGYEKLTEKITKEWQYPSGEDFASCEESAQQTTSETGYCAYSAYVMSSDVCKYMTHVGYKSGFLPWVVTKVPRDECKGKFSYNEEDIVNALYNAGTASSCTYSSDDGKRICEDLASKVGGLYISGCKE